MVLSASQVSKDEEQYDAFLMLLAWEGVHPRGGGIELSVFTPNSIEVGSVPRAPVSVTIVIS